MIGITYYAKEIITCDDPLNDSNEDYYLLFPDECPCSLCSNKEPDNDWCWHRARYVADAHKHRITMHISASASQEASCDVPMAVIKKGRQAVFEYIVHNYDTDYTDYDHDNLDNEGFSWVIRNDEVTEALKHDTYYGFMIPEEKEVIE